MQTQSHQSILIVRLIHITVNYNFFLFCKKRIFFRCWHWWTQTFFVNNLGGRSSWRKFGPLCINWNSKALPTRKAGPLIGTANCIKPWSTNTSSESRRWITIFQKSKLSSLTGAHAFCIFFSSSSKLIRFKTFWTKKLFSCLEF